MNSDERIKKLVVYNDPFWISVLKEFIRTVYEDEEEGIKALEKLSESDDTFNEFIR